MTKSKHADPDDPEPDRFGPAWWCSPSATMRGLVSRL